MTEKILPVVCIDENKNPITASIQPSRVRLSIPEEMEGVAKVQLTTAEIKQARASSVHQIPFFELPDDRIIKSSSPVEISLPEKESLPEHSVTNHRLGFVLSKNLLGKYEVKIENLPDVLGAPIRIRATSAARTAYEDMPYQVVLEVYDSDIKLNGPITRRLKYNFPDKFLINEEIELNQQPVEARFTLVPVKPSD